jgi:hypothetical protein
MARRDALASLALAAVIACATAGAAGAQKLDVVTDGLANPRGLSFGPGGALYVAEAGRGGSGGCVPSGEPGGPPNCYGATGAITRVDVESGRKTRIARQLPSLAPKEGQTAGQDATGPHDISFRGSTGYFTVGLLANPAARSQLGSAGARFAGLYRVNRRGKVSRVADLGAYEAKSNPDAGQPGAEIDTNPFSVDATGSGEILVTDAGANDLLSVTPGGAVKTLAVFPFRQTLAPPFLGAPPGTRIPYQPVPTGVVRVSRRTAYVGQLTGFPFPVGAANVFRVKGSGAPKVKASGFTTVVDIALDEDRSLYVLQISSTGLAGPPSPGKLIRVAANGKKTELAAGMLEGPTGIAVSGDGDIYVANKGSSGTDAEIVRIPVED